MKKEHDRDARDLRILRMLDRGVMQKEAARREGITRGSITRMLREIREDEAND